MSLKTKYSGQIQSKEGAVDKKTRFNWLAFGLWLVSIPISLAPVYVSALKYLGENEALDTNYWFKCITKDDVLWVFATLLLFALINSIAGKTHANGKQAKHFLKALYIVAAFIFILMEITWICLKYFIATPAVWSIYLSAVLIVCSFIISIPLEIDFIREGG